MCSNQERHDNNLLKWETNRFKTFASWCTLDERKKVKLAKFGFYFKQPPNVIKCIFCNLEVPYDPSDNGLKEHMRWSPDCPLLNHQPIDNVPVDPDASANQLKCPGTMYTPIQFRENSCPEGLQMASDATLDQIHRHDYNRLSQRVRSFKNWPHNNNKPNASKLGEAGFFYSGQHDQVHCFSCGGGFKDLKECCDPWELHALWYENCRYLRNSKPISFIVNVKKKYEK